jgi:hypothetical protein
MDYPHALGRWVANRSEEVALQRPLRGGRAPVLALKLRGAINSTKAENAACPTGVRRDPVSKVINVSVNDAPAAVFRIIQRHGVKAENTGVGSDRWCFFGRSIRHDCLISWLDRCAVAFGYPVAPCSIGARMSGQHCGHNGNDADDADNATDDGGQNLST